MRLDPDQKEKLIKYSIILLPLILGFLSNFLVDREKIPKVNTSKMIIKINPPPWVFSVVWPILYILLGYSSYLIYKEKDYYVLALFAVHLVLLTAWWPLFIKYPNRLYATLYLVFIFLYSLLLGFLYFRINKKAFYCIITYILWLAFATYLSYHT